MLGPLDNEFDDHPSLVASLEDFENDSTVQRSPLFGLPSQHSGFRSEESDDEMDDPTPSPWSPPGFRPDQDHVPGSGWYRHSGYSLSPSVHHSSGLRPTLPRPSASPSVSREGSPYEDAPEAPSKARSSDHTEKGDIAIAANVPLPIGAGTPQIGRSPSPSLPQRPGATREGPQDDGLDFGAENLSNCRHCLIQV